MSTLEIILTTLLAITPIVIHLIYDRKLKNQQNLINEYEIKERELQEAENKKAMIKGNIYSSNVKGVKNLVVFNAGKATAYNIRVEILTDLKGIICSEIKPYEMLHPQDKFENTFHLAYGHSPTIKIKYIWDDEHENNRDFVQVLDLG